MLTWMWIHRCTASRWIRMLEERSVAVPGGMDVYTVAKDAFWDQMSVNNMTLFSAWDVLDECDP